MNKPLTYALLLATALGLAACEKTPEDKMESAKESVSEAMENLGDAAKDTGDAIEQKTNEALGNEPTTGEKLRMRPAMRPTPSRTPATKPKTLSTVSNLS
ncbi:hypothetical protein OMD46_14825 [Pseudomonas sp. MDMC_285]|nr:hypothetical protein [Pseudomonas sp. MDMC_285]